MRNIYRVYKKVVIITSFITVFASIILKKAPGYELIGCIPTIYLICFLVAQKLHRYSLKFIGLFILNLIMFLKYVVTILAQLISCDYELADYYFIVLQRASCYWATFIIIFEMISVFIFIELFSSRFYGYSVNKIATGITNIGNLNQYNPIDKSAFLYCFLFIAFIIIVAFPSQFLKNSMIIFSSENSLTENFEPNNVLSVIFFAFKIILMGLMMNKCIIKYQENRKIRYLFLAYLILAVYTFLNVSTSRLNIIIPFFFFCLLTTHIFGRKGIIFDLVCVFLLVVVFKIVSIYKNPWSYKESLSPFETIRHFMKGFQYYTSGVTPTAIGLQCIEEYSDKISFFTLFHDIFGSVPLLSHLIKDENRIYTIYNLYALGGRTNSQLIPMTVSSIGYFSIFFAPLAVLVNVYLLMKIESKQSSIKSNFLDRYLNLYLYFIFASCLISNVQMLSGRFFVNFLPSAFILLVNKYSRKIKITCRRD